MKVTIVLLVLLSVGLEIYRYYRSMDARFYRDIDFHCYKEFAKIYNGIPQDNVHPDVGRGVNDRRALNLNESIFVKDRYFYGNYVCDYGLMYYPALFIHLTGKVYDLMDYSARKIQLVHVVVMLVTHVGMLWVAFEKFIVPKGVGVISFVLVHSLLSQTVYKTGISFLTNDVWCALFGLIMMIGIKKRFYWLTTLGFSMFISFKMNGLLYFPGLFVIYLADIGIIRMAFHGLFVFGFQVLVGLPFLIRDHHSYLKIAYNFSRDFDQTENIFWGWIGDDIRHQAWFYRLLLLCTAFFGGFMLLGMLHLLQIGKKANLERYRLFTLVGSHFIAFVFVRGAHIQFTHWIYFSLSFLISQIFGKKRVVFYILFLIIYDYCLNDIRKMFHLTAIPLLVQNVWNFLISRDLGYLSSFFNVLKQRDSSLFGWISYIPPEKLDSSAQYHKVLGYFYAQAFGPLDIPASFVVFAIHCTMIYLIFKKVKVWIQKERRYRI